MQDDLLGGLGADAAPLDRLELLFDIVLALDIGDLLLRIGKGDLMRGKLKRIVRDHLPAAKRIVFARFAVDRHPHFDVFGEAFFGRRGECQLQCAKHNVLGHILFTRQCIDQHEDLATH